MKWGIFWLFQNFRIQISKFFHHLTYFSVTWLDIFSQRNCHCCQQTKWEFTNSLSILKTKRWLSACNIHFELYIGGAADAVTTFLLITSDRKEMQACVCVCVVSLCSADQDGSNDMHFHLFWPKLTLRSRDLRSNFDLNNHFELYRWRCRRCNDIFANNFWQKRNTDACVVLLCPAWQDGLN